MKRSLLLMAMVVAVLAVPTTASACQEICESAFLPCVYETQTYSYCLWDGWMCWMHYCRTSSAENPELLSSKWKIASIEIERPGPVPQRETEPRLASHPEPVKGEPLPALE